MKQKEEQDSNNEQKFSYFRSLSRIALIIFIAFSLFAFVGTSMLIFLTKPKKEIQVPDLQGKKFIEVYSQVVRKGLVPEIEFKDMFDVEDGIILRQYIDSGEIVKVGTTIDLLVSRSKLRFDAPSLIGLSLPKAKNKLKNLHVKGKAVSLKVGVITYMISNKYKENHIIKQNPNVKERIDPNQKINLLVSSGLKDKSLRMPKVTGQKIDLVYDMLLSKGLKVDIETVVTSSIQKSGTILSQKPYRGATLKDKKNVLLKVAYYQLKDHPFAAYEKVNLKIPENNGEGLYELQVEDLHSKRIRFSKKMKGGRSLKTIFYRKGNAKINIYKDKKQIRTFEIGVN